MRNLLLVLIAFLAVITFIRAFEKPGAAELRDRPPEIVEFNVKN
ncbi:hypothetical protein AGMMS50293_08510 [Spirochaetia bacterium]|nr:hypothetical protein AGMMS50293_08510 [Spirochaetia bacterium]